MQCSSISIARRIVYCGSAPLVKSIRCDQTRYRRSYCGGWGSCRRRARCRCCSRRRGRSRSMSRSRRGCRRRRWCCRCCGRRSWSRSRRRCGERDRGGCAGRLGSRTAAGSEHERKHEREAAHHFCISRRAADQCADRVSVSSPFCLGRRRPRARVRR